MPQKRTDQVSVFDLLSHHEIGRELKAISAHLDQHRQLAEWVVADLVEDAVHATGREELLAESVLQKTISRIRPETWKRINRCLLAGAQAVQLERDLSRVTQNTLGYLEHAERALTLVQPAGQGCLASPGNAL